MYYKEPTRTDSIHQLLFQGCIPVSTRRTSFYYRCKLNKAKSKIKKQDDTDYLIARVLNFFSSSSSSLLNFASNFYFTEPTKFYLWKISVYLHKYTKVKDTEIQSLNLLLSLKGLKEQIKFHHLSFTLKPTLLILLK